MIFGDPNNFAIMIDWIPEWHTGEYAYNGIFAYVIDGFFFPPEVRPSSLGEEIDDIDFNGSFVRVPENRELFELASLDAFRVMLEKIYPDYFDVDVIIDDGFVEDYSYRVSTDTMSGACLYFFAVSYGGVVRILGGRTRELFLGDEGTMEWRDVSRLHIHEAFLSGAEFIGLYERLKKGWADIRAVADELTVEKIRNERNL